MTIFSIPKEFIGGHIGLIQEKAVKSWVALGDVFLMGKRGGKEAQKYGANYTRDIKYNEKGRPFVSSAFKKIQEVKDDGVYMYTNADMVFDESLKEAVAMLPKSQKFLMVGRRIDIDTEDLSRVAVTCEEDAGLRRDFGADFLSAFSGQKIRSKVARKDDDEETTLDCDASLAKTTRRRRLLLDRDAIAREDDDEGEKKGVLHSPAGIDYFIFPKGLFTDMPDLVVGRIGWDNWMIYHAKKSGYMVIDATEVIRAYHQNHDYPNYNKGVERKTNPEALKNIEVVGSKKNVMTIEDADWRITKKGLKRNWLGWLPALKRRLKELKVRD